MVSGIYRIDGDNVDPIFYPVVPDSFMRRRPERLSIIPLEHALARWPGELEPNAVTLPDRWSF